jgi:hypothetical protein
LADILKVKKASSTAEIRTWDVDFTPDMRTGVTVSSATAIHTPPSGSASAVTVGTISSNIVPVQIGTQSVTGTHRIEIRATLSDAQVSTALIEFQVIY